MPRIKIVQVLATFCRDSIIITVMDLYVIIFGNLSNLSRNMFLWIYRGSKVRNGALCLVLELWTGEVPPLIHSTKLGVQLASFSRRFQTGSRGIQLEFWPSPNLGPRRKRHVFGPGFLQRQGISS